MGRQNRRARRAKVDPAIVDTLEPRLLLSATNCCGEDIALSQNTSQDGPSAQSEITDRSGSVTGRIRPNNRHDWFDLNIASDTAVTLSLTELTGNLRLRLYDEDGRIAGSNNRGRTDEIIETELTPGSYRVRVSGHRLASGGARIGSYRLSWDLTPLDSAGGTLNTARDLGSVGSAIAQEYVGPEDRVDIFRFTVDQRSDLELSLVDLSEDADLRLLNARGQRLAISNQSGSADELISGQVEAGTYYAVVTPWESAASTFTVTVDAEAIAEPPDLPGEGDGGSFPDVPDLRGANNWHLNAVNAPEVWAQGYTGEGVLVAVVDTGVDLDHPDLASNIYVNAGEIAGNGIDDDGNGFVDDVSGWDFTTNTNDANDINGHGTHVAGIIAADSNGFGATGVAYDATILPVQVLGDNGSGSNRSVADGIRYAVDAGADIVNLSLGGGFSSLIRSAIRYAELNDVLVVAASGNESSATPGYPARFSNEFSNTLSVGAFDINEQLAGFSNRVGNSGAVQVDAPGVSVYSTYPDGRYARLSGTSMAAPNASGVAALALSANPDLSAAQLRALVVDGATESIVNSDSIGRVNAAVTVARAAGGLAGNGGRSLDGANDGSGSNGFGALSLRTSTTSFREPTTSAEDLFNEEPDAGRVIVAAAQADITASSAVNHEPDGSTTFDNDVSSGPVIAKRQSSTSLYSALDSLFSRPDLLPAEG